ncbi:LytTr DNA-binding domain protein [compost metagenome]
MTTRMLKEFEEYLGEQSSFVRINKSILANPDFIVKYSKGEPGILTMENSQTFEVSRRKKQEILDKLNSRKAKK